MRIFFFILSILLLVEGVSGDEKVKVTVSGMKGDSVTLKPGDAEIQTGDWILWKFNNIIIFKMEKTNKVYTSDADIAEKFKGRMQLDKTGSLTITNISTTDSGPYQLQIRKSTGVIPMEYNVSVKDVFVVDTDGVKSVSVMEGDTVTLHTGVTDIQRDDVIQWKFKDEVIRTDGLNGGSNLNNPTGELTIRNIQLNQSGVYEVKISTSNMILLRKLRINISGKNTVSVMAGESIILYTDLKEIQGNDLILWKFEDHLIAGINKSGDQFFSHDTSDERFKGRLQLDRHSGALTIRGSRSTDSGVYHLNMSSSSHSLQRSISVTVSVFDADVVKTVTVMEGDSVTLNPDLTQIQGINLILWRFGASGSVIAETNGTEISYPHLTEIFGGRLQLNHQTGSLTINNMRTKHTGLYQLKIDHNTGISSMAFIVTVSAITVSIDWKMIAFALSLVLNLVLVLIAVIVRIKKGYISRPSNRSIL